MRDLSRDGHIISPTGKTTAHISDAIFFWRWTMSFRGCLAILVTALLAYALGAQGRDEKKVETSPHAAALELVFKTQQARIRELDGEDWWQDVKERTWAVKRPFAPGYIDSTHWFNVSYRIDGRDVATWCVDTNKGNVQVIDAKGKKL
jgi:hypothetical protein